MGSQLTAYIEQRRDLPFDWRGNNCLAFVSGALEACGLSGLPRDWCAGYSTAREALRAYRTALRAYGHDDIIDAMDARYERVLTLHPRDGMICARKTDDVMGYAFGVVLHGGCVFVTGDGARWSDVEAGDMFWRAV